METSSFLPFYFCPFLMFLKYFLIKNILFLYQQIQIILKYLKLLN